MLGELCSHQSVCLGRKCLCFARALDPATSSRVAARPRAAQARKALGRMILTCELGFFRALFLEGLEVAPSKSVTQRDLESWIEKRGTGFHGGKARCACLVQHPKLEWGALAGLVWEGVHLGEQVLSQFSASCKALRRSLWGYYAQDTEQPRRGVPANSRPCSCSWPLARTCIAVLGSQQWGSQTWVHFLPTPDAPSQLVYRPC